MGICRVYLMGGASSTGTSKDTVVVYTPALLDEGIYIANLTVPEGLFWSDIINPPGALSFQVCFSESTCFSDGGLLLTFASVRHAHSPPP